MSQTILIIDDEEDIRDLLGDIFVDEGFHILKAAHSEQALSLIKNNNIDLMVLDIWLDNSDMDGIQILKHLKSQNKFKDIPVLMISGHGNVEMAVNAMKIGAFDFIEKPFKIDHILLTVQRALEQKNLKEENFRLKETSDFGALKHQYKSQSMLNLIKSVNDQADSDARSMIIGAHGTGKTRLAKAIHDISKRANHAIKFLEAFTLTIPMLDDELSHNPHGTIVIENIHRIDKLQQTELLNYLSRIQHGCRIICTADDDITNLIKSQKFSSALYDRLAIIKFNIPQLKNRPEDIAILIDEFISVYQKEFGCIIRNDFLPIEKLKNLAWKGNVKQLKTAVEWMVFCQNCEVPSEVSYQLPFIDKSNQTSVTDSADIFFEEMFTLTLKEARDRFEYKYLTFILEKFEGNIAKVASFIDMDRTALHRKLKSMNLTFEGREKAQSA